MNTYSIEEMENSAMQKKEMAKKVGLVAGAAALGGGTIFGANAILNNQEEDEEADLNVEDIENAADDAQVQEEQPVQQEQPVQETIIVERPVVVHEVKPAPEPEPDVTFENREVIIDDDGNVLASKENGKVQGHDFSLYDLDGDNNADYLWIDQNNDHAMQEEEVMNIEEQGITMGNAPIVSDKDITVVDTDQYEAAPADMPDHTDIHDIANDFDDDGGSIHNDLAQNNPDYRNHEDVSNFSRQASVNLDETTTVDSADGYATEETQAEEYAMEPEPVALDSASDYAQAESAAFDSSSDYAQAEPAQDYAQAAPEPMPEPVYEEPAPAYEAPAADSFDTADSFASSETYVDDTPVDVM